MVEKSLKAPSVDIIHHKINRKFSFFNAVSIIVVNKAQVGKINLLLCTKLHGDSIKYENHTLDT